MKKRRDILPCLLQDLCINNSLHQALHIIWLLYTNGNLRSPVEAVATPAVFPICGTELESSVVETCFSQLQGQSIQTELSPRGHFWSRDQNLSPGWELCWRVPFSVGKADTSLPKASGMQTCVNSRQLHEWRHSSRGGCHRKMRGKVNTNVYNPNTSPGLAFNPH